MTIYEAIQIRHSVRKYTSDPLPENALKKLKQDIKQLNEHYQGHFRIEILEKEAAKESKAGTVYGMVKLKSPYVLVLIGKQEEALTAGYEGEKLVLELTKQGVGTCWLGTYSKEKIIKECQVKKEEQIFCVITVGMPVEGSFLNGTFRQVLGGKRKPIEQIAFDESGKGLTTIALQKHQALYKAILAGNKAPSANNIQPWRVVIREKKMSVYYKKGFEVDGGIFLAHIILVLQEEGLQLSWKKDSIKQDTTEWIEAAKISWQ